MSKTNPARGMRDFLPVDVRKREYVIGIIKQVYESYGYEPLETPAVENIETLMGKYGDEGNQLVFKILKRGEKLAEKLAEFGELAESSNSGNSVNSPNSLSDLALRYDITVPLARVIADRRNQLPKFFKRYQIQPVWRADRPARGRFREFYQCDVDAIGSSSVIVEAEIITAASDILDRLGFDDFVVRINHRQLLSQMASDAGISNENEAFVALDKLDKIGVEGVKNDLLSRGIDGATAGKFLSSVTGDVTFPELNRVIALCNSPRVKIDPSLARGLSYYTGTIMEINVPDIAGSLGGGGRYDGLIGMFGKEQIPACGFSLGLERILVVMDERGMFPPEIAESRAADVMVTIWNDETIPDSLRLADDLRKQNLRVLVYPEADKLGKQVKYADSTGVPFVCLLGPDEIENGVAKLKNMRTGEETTGPAVEIFPVIARSR